MAEKTQFIRVKDSRTRHEFDVPEGDWRIGTGDFVPVKSDRYPPVAIPRRPKYFVQPAPRAEKKEVANNG
jgi:hypothetical protein